MVAKLIVWDVDRERATARMLRALDEFEIEGVTTLIPFHKAIMASEQWAEGRDLPRPDRGPEWLKALAAAQAREAAPSDEPEPVERTYTVEVSGKRFDVTVHGEPMVARAPTAPRPRRRASRAARRAREVQRRRRRPTS